MISTLRLNNVALSAAVGFFLACTSFSSEANEAGKQRNITLTCIALAANEFQLPPKLLLALYYTERGLVGRGVLNKNGSIDHGPFQINSLWLAKLQPYGVTASNLTWDPLLNSRVAAWRLRSEIILANGDVWRGVGNYRSRTPKFHNEEIIKVASYMRRIPDDLIYHGGC